MANLIIKPSSGNSLVFQDEGGDAAITVDTSGNTALAGNTTAAGTLAVTGATTHTGNVTVANITASGTTTGFAAAAVAGDIVKTSLWHEENTAAHRGDIGSTSFENTGLEVAHVTAKSSTDSILRFDCYLGMMHAGTADRYAYLDLTMRTVSNTTYTAAESIASGPSFLMTHHQPGNNYVPQFISTYCGLATGTSPFSMGMPTTKSTWAVGDTLYFRLFAKVAAGDFRLCHSGSNLYLQITEILR